jgi:uncharacterized protein (TIGR02453 family)
MSFSNQSVAFLRELERHNAKPWFESNRHRYEAHIRQPLRDLVEEMDVRLARLAPEIVGDVKRSPFRIYRDIRFSADKSPYKTHASCWFFHRDGAHSVGREAIGGGAGFYFELSATRSFVGGGMWMPPRAALRQLRAAIVDDQPGFEHVVASAAVKRKFGALGDEAMLKRTPRGYAADHPAAHWLRHQSFVFGRELSIAQATSPRLPALLERDFETMLPLVRWLNRALGLMPANRR